MSTNPVTLPVLHKTIDTIVELPRIELPRIDGAIVRHAAKRLAAHAYPIALGLGFTLAGRAVGIPITAGYPLLSHFFSEEDWDGKKPTVRQFAAFYTTYAIGVASAYTPELMGVAQRLLER